MVRRKRLLLFSVLFAFLILAATSSGWAYPFEVGDVITLHNGPGTTNGGEFIIKENGTVIHNTFCLEKSETFSYGQPLTIWDITDSAKAGGIGAENGEDEISAETKYLFYHFIKKDLDGYNYGSDGSANALQMAIWYLEEELGVLDYNKTDVYNYNYFTMLAHEQIIRENTAGIDSVMVLNLYKADGSNAQDQLTVVPEPGTLLSLGIVLLGLGGITRRRFKN